MEISVEIPSSTWQSVTPDRSRLTTTVVVNGLVLHIDAIEVEVDEYRIQRAVGEADETLDLLHAAVGADGHWETLDIEGREYVLIATPSC